MIKKLNYYYDSRSHIQFSNIKKGHTQKGYIRNLRKKHQQITTSTTNAIFTYRNCENSCKQS